MWCQVSRSASRTSLFPGIITNLCLLGFLSSVFSNRWGSVCHHFVLSCFFNDFGKLRPGDIFGVFGLVPFHFLLQVATESDYCLLSALLLSQ